MTKLYLTTASADAGVTAGSGTKWATGWAPGSSSTHLNKNSVVGPTAPLQVTDGATAGTDGTVVSWYTEPLWGVTIAGQIIALLWDRENATANNVAPSIRIERCSGDGTPISTIVSETTNHGAGEMPTTAGGATDTVTMTAANVTDTTISDGDRLRITLWIDDASDQGGTGSMASGGRGEFWVNGPNGAAGQSEISFTELVMPQAGPRLISTPETSWTTTTTPKTLTAVGALSADLMVAMYGGDNFSDPVSATAVTTTGGSTSAWTKVQEALGASNQAWKSNAWATVSANGDATASLARTQAVQNVWGGFLALLRENGGIGNTAQLTNGATETVALTTSANSIVLALGIDWDDLTNVAFLPTGAHDVERSAGTAVAWYAGLWVGCPAGSRNYGIATSSTANFVLTLIEILAPVGTTPIGKDLGLVWDTRAALGDSLSVIWDVRAAVSDDLVGIWDVRANIGASIGLLWDLRAALGDNMALVWDVRAVLGDEVALVWDVRAAVGDPIQVIWDVRSIVGDPVVLVWDVRSPSGQTLQLIWDVQGNTLLATKDLSLVWNISAFLADSLDLRWDVRGVLGDDLAIVWDVRALVGAAMQALWDVRSVVGDPLSLQWDLRATSGDDLTLRWDLKSSAGDNLTLIWNIESLAPTLQHSFTTSVPDRWRFGPDGNGVLTRWDAQVPERWRTGIVERNEELVPERWRTEVVSP